MLHIDKKYKFDKDVLKANTKKYRKKHYKEFKNKYKNMTQNELENQLKIINNKKRKLDNIEKYNKQLGYELAKLDQEAKYLFYKLEIQRRKDIKNKQLNKKMKEGDKKMNRKRKGYTYSERAAYHAKRAKGDAINPKTGKPYSKSQVAYSRGWLNKQKLEIRAFKYKNPKYRKKAI